MTQDSPALLEARGAATAFRGMATPTFIGKRLGAYVIERQIGQGGTGAVFVARHRTLGTRKAVKVLLPHFAAEPTVVRRFANEAMAAARLDHRNILRVDDFGQLSDQSWYILMPFVDGISLEEFLSTRPKIELHVALHILGQICAALQAAHDAQIVHRDLKPGNVMLSRRAEDPWHVTLLDFGIAKVELPDAMTTSKGSTLGTPEYMAAEQFEDASSTDYRADLFSLGVIAYRMVTGEYPFGRERLGLRLYHKQLEQRPARPLGVPKGWADEILAALAVDPAQRPASARAFATALAAATPPSEPAYPAGARILAVVAREFAATRSAPTAPAAPAAWAAYGESPGPSPGEPRKPRLGEPPWPPVEPLPAELVVPRWAPHRVPVFAGAPVPAVGADAPTQSAAPPLPTVTDWRR